MSLFPSHPRFHLRRTALLWLMLVSTYIGAAAPATSVRYPGSNHRTRSDISYLMRYRGSLAIGYLNKDDKMDFYISRPVVLGGTVAVEFLPTGRWKCLQEWNNASVGLALTAVDLGHSKFLGQAIAPHAYFNIPLVNHPRAVFGLRPGAGIGFVTRTYANTVPDDQRWQNIKVNGEQVANASIGSVANAFMTAGFYLDFPFSDNWDVTLSFVREGKPIVLMNHLRNEGFEITEYEAGIYHVRKKGHIDMQILVTREMSWEYTWLKVLTDRLTKEDAEHLVHEASKVKDEQESTQLQKQDKQLKRGEYKTAAGN